MAKAQGNHISKAAELSKAIPSYSPSRTSGDSWQPHTDRTKREFRPSKHQISYGSKKRVKVHLNIMALDKKIHDLLHQ